MILKILKYMYIIGIILTILFFAYVGHFFSPDFFRKYDQPTLLFLLILYAAFYVLHFILEKKLSPEKLVGKDLIFLSLKFLIPVFYAAIRQYFIDDIRDKKIFLFHFLIYAVLFLVLDTLIYYQVINRKS